MIVTYYIILFIALFAYWTHREKRLNITDFIVVEVTILFSLVGPYISSGAFFGINGHIDSTLLLLYLINGTVLIIGFIYGKKIKIKNKISNHKVSDRILKLSILFIIIYSIGFFYIIRDNIPIIKLLLGYSSEEVKIARLQTTHNFSTFYNTLIIYRYRNLVFNFLTLYTFSICFLKRLKDKNRYSKIFNVFFPVVLITQFYAVEKGPMIILFMIMIFDYYMYHYYINDLRITRKSIYSKFKYVLRVALFCFSFLVLYSYFMGVDSISLGFYSMINRIFIEQSSSVYLQKIILDNVYGGCLYGQGISLTMIDTLIGRVPIKLTKDVYDILYYSYSSEGGAGTTGTMPAFYLYSNFGIIITTIITLFISLFTGYIDKKTSHVVNNSKEFILPMAYRSMVLVLIFSGYMSTYATFLSFPFIVSIEFLFIIIITKFFSILK